MNIGMIIALIRNSIGPDAKTLKFTDPDGDGSIKVTVVSSAESEAESE